MFGVRKIFARQTDSLEDVRDRVEKTKNRTSQNISFERGPRVRRVFLWWNFKIIFFRTLPNRVVDKYFVRPRRTSRKQKPIQNVHVTSNTRSHRKPRRQYGFELSVVLFSFSETFSPRITQFQTTQYRVRVRKFFRQLTFDRNGLFGRRKFCF